MRSYVTIPLGVPARINETWNLYLGHARNVRENVRGLLNQARASDAKIMSLLGCPVNDMKMLEVGPGQQLIQLAYFGKHNDVVGIDLDVIVQRVDATGCLRMARQNGWLRTCKTLARKMAGIDKKMRRELVSQLGLHSLPKLPVLQMDAAKMEFPDQHFDVVFSRAVFEHLPDPGAVIAEISRVLKPGGVMFLTFHLFSSDSGSHDTRIFVGKRETLPFWAHLRPEHEKEVRSNSYLNKLRLDEWKQILQSKMPSSEVVALCDAGDVERRELQRLRSQGQLRDYSDEELLSVTVEAGWRKPLPCQSKQACL
jgi:SAM-dependent methyltransferase